MCRYVVLHTGKCVTLHILSNMWVSLFGFAAALMGQDADGTIRSKLKGYEPQPLPSDMPDVTHSVGNAGCYALCRKCRVGSVSGFRLRKRT